MRIDRRLVGLGLFLVTTGSVMLAIHQGLVSEAVGQRAWTLWPLLLIGSGLSIVLAGRPGAALGGLVVAVTFGAILGGLAGAGWTGGFGACGGDRTGTAFANQGGNLAPGSSVSISVNCGHLTVGTVAGSIWSMSGSSPDGAAPRVRTTGGTLRIDGPERNPFGAGAEGNDWTVILPRDIGIEVDVATNGGSSDLALGGANLRDASFETNAGSLTIDLRDVAAIGGFKARTNFGSTTIRLPARSLTGEISVNAGSAALCLPAGAGIRIKLDGVAASNDLARHGFVQVADRWETSGYAAATIRLELAVDVNAGSLAIDPGRECSA